MKRRYRFMLNIFSIALLSIALYLNFVKKEAEDFSVPPINGNTADPTTPATKDSKISSVGKSEHTIVLK